MNTKLTKILLIEDNLSDVRLIREMLTEAGEGAFELEYTDRLSKTLECPVKEDIDVFLLGLSLPDAQGLDSFMGIQPQASRVPVLVLTDHADEELAVEAVRAGAQDYLVKGQIGSHGLVRAIRYAIERARAEQALQKAYDELERRVEERTAELQALDKSLQSEIESRERAQEALRESEERFRGLAENVEGAFWLGTLAAEGRGRILYVNPAFERVFGITPEETYESDCHWADILHEDDRERTLNALGAFVQGEGDYDAEYRIVRPDGSTRWIWARGFYIRDEQGSIQRTAGLAQDITERKQAEEALQRSEERYRELIENLNDVIFSADPNGTITYISPPVGALLGYDPADFVGTHFADLVHPDDRILIRRAFEDALKGQLDPSEYRILAQDGEYRWVRASSRPVQERGEGVGLRGVLSDITERKRAEEALQESEELHRVTMEHILDPLFITDDAGRFTFICGNVPRILGYSIEELLGMGSISKLVGEDLFNLEELKARGAIYNIESAIVDKQGRDRDYVVTVRRVSIKGGTVLYAFHDITERKQAEQALRQRTTQLEALRKIGLEIAAQLNLNTLLETIVSRAISLLDGNTGGLYLYRPEREVLEWAMAMGPELAPIGTVLHRGEGLSGRVWETGKALVVDDYQHWEGRAAIYDGHPSITIAAAPVRWGSEFLGVLNVLDQPPRIFSPSDVEMLSLLANQAAIAIKNVRLFEEVESGRRQLRALAGYLQNAREKERTHIAREIHDEFGQALTALRIDLSWCMKRLPLEQTHLVEKANDMITLVDDTIRLVRRVATELRPGLLDDLGLLAALEWQARDFYERTGVDCDLALSNEETVLDLDSDLVTALFRIFQEALTNVARHADATQVEITMERRTEELVLTVRDNGRGISKRQVSSPRSLGLIGMRERARSWGGDITFQGYPGQGTTVTVRVPLHRPT